MNRKSNLPSAQWLLQVAGGLAVLLGLAQPAHASGAWLDRPLVDWNRPGGAMPQLPQPPAIRGDPGDVARCASHQVRKPASAGEQALVQRGWLLYGPVYSYDSTRIVTALSGFDGMCRPIGYQAFVYWDGRYAGTLSPVAMDSRSDGALTNIHLSGPGHFSAEFVRYGEDDPLCCPSGVDYVAYTLQRDDIPTLTASDVTHTTGKMR